MNDRRIQILYGLEAADAGALKHLMQLICHLDRTQYAITVMISPNRSKRIQQEITTMRTLGIVVILLPMEGKIHPLRDLKMIFKVRAHLKLRHYDIVHAHSSKAGVIFRIAAWLSGVHNNIYTAHCFYFQAQKGFSRLLFCWIERLLGSITTSFIVSSTEKEWMLRYRIAPLSKIMVINNAIDRSEYLPTETKEQVRSRWNIPHDHLVIGGVGRLCKQKDWPTLIYAAQQVILHHPQVSFIIAGEGEEMDCINLLISSLHLEGRVLLIGQVEDINNVYALFDIFVNVSLWEGLPYVLLEAMCFKLPIVASDLGYQDVLYDETNALLFTPGSVEQLSDKIISLVADQGRRKALGVAGYEHLLASCQFSDFVQKHDELYQFKRKT
ncbi:glycosyltransferase [Sphingobacterium faecium]|uniref:glycosyltransferase n=1 Tax=Sphingobacterium faecium TaxID=34087 RepID=UPI00320ADA20